MPPFLDKGLSSMQAHENSRGKKNKRTIKEERKKGGGVKIGGNLAKFQDKP